MRLLGVSYDNSEALFHTIIQDISQIHGIFQTSLACYVFINCNLNRSASNDVISTLMLYTSQIGFLICRDSNELSTRDLQKMVQALPQYSEQMEKLSLHVEVDFFFL